MNLEKEIKKLYKDAAYYHLLRQGCTKLGAKVQVFRLYE
jgi:hypothetical protein